MTESKTKINKWRDIASSKKIEYTVTEKELKLFREDVIQAKDNHSASIEAQKITQAVAETIQEEAHNQISGVVSQCLSAVFDDPYEFRIRFERARGRTEAHLVFVRDGNEINPIDSSGGGVVDVAAFALRISCLMLSRPPCRRTVVLDEPFRFVSAEFRPRVRTMLLELSRDLNIQFIMITHIKEFSIGKVIEIDEL